MVEILIKSLWLFLPAACANMAAPIAAKMFPYFSYPLDFGLKFGDKRILGANKTVRGFIAGIVVGEAIFLLERFFATNPFFEPFFLIDYASLPFYFGLIFGFGALGGDMVKSFFKRQFNIASGKTWFPFDQIDWILGTIIVLTPFVSIPIQIILIGLTGGFLLHILVKFIGFNLRLDAKPI